ncbi:MAG: NAD+ synthase [Betaproteobacteria bacterium]|nr:NAD+ synthase [Betaproteobacteria bacterium]
MLTIAIAQINAVVGDIAGNADRIRAAAATARQAGADLLLTPELALCGCPPEDLLLRPEFYRACDAALAALARDLDGIALLVAHPEECAGRHYNAATLIVDGRLAGTCRKIDLSNGEVLDEKRYFDAGEQPFVFELKGVRCGVRLGSGLSGTGSAETARETGVELLLALDASPYRLDRQGLRLAAAREQVSAAGIPMVYANLVGGQDELVFDGGSFALDRRGGIVCRLPQFNAATQCLVYRDGDLRRDEGRALAPVLGREEELHAALVLGVRDYIGKNGFPGVLLGLSGGIDSALVLAIAVHALGAEKVRAVMMPSPYTSQISLDDARYLARQFGVRYDEIPIEPLMESYAGSLGPVLETLPPPASDTTQENIQARIRGNLLMALSNRSGALVLTTGNKSETAAGYCTLYGDMAGGFAAIKDVYKTMVYRLARWLNHHGEVIPERIITRAPSAELRHGQTDQDSLPPYEILDSIIEAYMEHGKSEAEIVASGHAAADVRQAIGLLGNSEYKRRQSPPGIRVTSRGFDRDWRYPLTNRFRP